MDDPNKVDPMNPNPAVTPDPAAPAPSGMPGNPPMDAPGTPPLPVGPSDVPAESPVPTGQEPTPNVPGETPNNEQPGGNVPPAV